MAEGLPVVEISLDKLVGLEPDEKMEIEEYRVKMESMAQAIKEGKILDPILVRVYENGYQVLDGHHRLHAYKKAGAHVIPCRVVPEEAIEIMDSRKE